MLSVELLLLLCVDVAAVAFMLNNVLFMALTITAARHGLLWPGLGFQ